MATDRFQIAASVGVTNSGKIDKIFQYDGSVNSFTEMKYDFPDFDVNSPDALYFGDSSEFYSLYVDITEAASSQNSLGMTLYYWNGSWTSITEDTGTNYANGFSQSGDFSWITNSITDWVAVDLDTAASVSGVDSVNRYWMKVEFEPTTQNMPLVIHEAKLEEPPTYTTTGLSPWTFTLNPSEMTPHPDREQSTRRTMDGSVNVQAATGDGNIRTMMWTGLDESRWEEFIHGITGSEQGKFDKVYFYNDQVTRNTSLGETEIEPRRIIDQTYQSYTQTTLSIPFKDGEDSEWVSGSNTTDRLLLGMASKFYGIRFEFKKTGNQYLTTYIGDNNISNIESIQLRFSDSDGDLGGSVSTLTISKDSNYSYDGTELFTHDGQIKWTASDVTNWSAVDLNDVINNTSDLSDPDPKVRDTEELYWVEVQLNYHTQLATPTTGYHQEKTQNIKISEVRSAIDSLYYLSFVRSDGTLPYWYLYIPSSLKNYRPRDKKEWDWIPIKVIDLLRKPSQGIASVKKRWDVELKYVVATEYEVPIPFRLDSTPLDSLAFYFLNQ